MNHNFDMLICKLFGMFTNIFQMCEKDSIYNFGITFFISEAAVLL